MCARLTLKWSAPPLLQVADPRTAPASYRQHSLLALPPHLRRQILASSQAHWFSGGANPNRAARSTTGHAPMVREPTSNRMQQTRDHER